MKQVETISVGGYAFTMEAEASAAAGAYLSELEAFYGSREIMEGIEERMAELLLEKTPSEGVVSKQTVSEIIDILGRPERLEAEEESAREALPSGEKAEKPRKKLYRDLEGGKLGGVLSGLGIYFGIDTVALRVIVTILAIAGFFGSANSDSGFLFFIIPLIYCILWISMPAAKTARQRWEQRGEDGSVEGIRRSVESGAGRVGDAIRDISRAPAWRTIGRVIEVSIGLLLLITAVSGLFAGALACFGWEWLGFGSFVSEATRELTEEFAQFPSVAGMFWVQMLAVLVYVIPFIGMLYGGIMLLFRFKSPSWRPGLWLFVIWLILLVALIILVLACVFSANV